MNDQIRGRPAGSVPPRGCRSQRGVDQTATRGTLARPEGPERPEGRCNRARFTHERSESEVADGVGQGSDVLQRSGGERL